MGKPEILIGKSNGFHLSVWEASEVMDCDLYFYAQGFHPELVYNLHRRRCHLPQIKTERYKTTFVNRLIFKYNLV